MTDTAYQTMYRQEFIAGYEQYRSLLTGVATKEAQIKGNSAVFLVADSNSRSAVTRGVNGLIPASSDSLTQNTCTLQEWHDKVRRTGFNIFASQGEGRQIMQMTTVGVMNRKSDELILAQLETGTNDTGSALPASLNMCAHAKAILGNNEVPYDGRIWAVISPAFEAYLIQVKEFTNANYVSVKPLTNTADPNQFEWGYYQWMGVKWIVHPNVTGKGTSAEKCLMFHTNAIGFAIDSAGMQTPVGYDQEDDYSYARASAYMGAKLLQNSGVVVMNHDGSAFAAS